jgi:hypothetical protein
MPAYYAVNCSLQRTPLLPGGYWTWQQTEDCLQATSSCRSKATSLTSPLACPSPPLLAPPLHPHTGHWLQIVEFSHASMPFGWTSSPRIWEALCQVLAASLRRAGIRVLIYVDDFLLAWLSKEKAYWTRILIEAAFTASCITRAPAKGQWVPSHVLADHLGFRISTVDRGSLKVPECRCRVLRALASDLLREAASSRRQVCSDKLHVFTGTSVSCIATIPQASLRLRSLFDCQEEYHPRSTLQCAQLRDLVCWTELTFDSLSNGALLWPPGPRAAADVRATRRRRRLHAALSYLPWARCLDPRLVLAQRGHSPPHLRQGAQGCQVRSPRACGCPSGQHSQTLSRQSGCCWGNAGVLQLEPSHDGRAQRDLVSSRLAPDQFHHRVHPFRAEPGGCTQQAQLSCGAFALVCNVSFCTRSGITCACQSPSTPLLASSHWWCSDMPRLCSTPKPWQWTAYCSTGATSVCGFVHRGASCPQFRTSFIVTDAAGDSSSTPRGLSSPGGTGSPPCQAFTSDCSQYYSLSSHIILGVTRSSP